MQPYFPLPQSLAEAERECKIQSRYRSNEVSVSLWPIQVEKDKVRRMPEMNIIEIMIQDIGKQKEMFVYKRRMSFCRILKLWKYLYIHIMC